MKKYEDKRISFLYPEGFKLIRKKSKWGQYDLAKKKETLIIINIISGELDTEERIIWSRPPNDIEGLAKMEYFKSVKIGGKKGIGHVATLYDHSHKFWGKIYRYLFPNSRRGGLYIEISDREDFTIDTYKEFMESIRLKDTDYHDETEEYKNNIANPATPEYKLQYFPILGNSLEKIELEIEHIPSDNKKVKLRQKKTLKEFQKREKEIFKKVKYSIYQYYCKVYPIYKNSMTTCYQIYNKDIKELNKMLNELLPEIKQWNELDDKIALSSIRVYDSDVIGLEFICSWDEEHGLGVLLKNYEIEDVGLGEVSYF